MNDGEFLSPAELHRLTASARAKAQAAWLADHGIPYLLDGNRVIVSRVHVRAWLEGKAQVVSSCEPTFDRPF